MSRLVRRFFSRVLDAPRPAPKVYRASDLRARLMVQALEGRVVPATFTVANAGDTGAGSLRQAITDANANPDADTIVFDATFFATPRTITLTSGQLTVSESVTITGPGAASLTVRRDAAAATQFRVFNIVNANAVLDVTLSGMTVSGGNVVNGDGGGISTSDERVTVLNSVITGNSITSVNTRYYDSGGGIGAAANGVLTIRNCTISGNTTVGRGGGVYVPNGGSLLLENSTVSGNSSTFSISGGGGVYFGGGGGAGTTGNVGAGGVTIRNSTISGNSAQSGGGIGLNNVNGTVLIQNSTITDNTATSFDTVSGRSGGGISKSVFNTNPTGNITLVSSIVSGNFTASQNTNFSDISFGGAGSVTATNSAIGVDPGAGVLSAASANNLAFGANLNLGPLTNNGGATLTHALGTGSAAIDKGSNPATLPTDQRRFAARVTGSAADIGAFEVGPFGIPFGVATAAIVTTNGGTSYTFTVTYEDDTALNVSTLGTGDVRVTGPNGFSQVATFVGVDNTANGTPRTATYTITPPGGSWDAADYGTYTISIEPNQVADTGGTFAPAGLVGTFQALTPGTFTVANTNDAGAGSLRQAILDAAARAGTTDTVDFDSTVFNTARTISLTSGELLLGSSVNVTGPGASLLTVQRSGATGTAQFRVFNAAAATNSTLSGLTVSGGNATADGGGILVGAGTSLTLDRVTVSGNTTTTQGGGIGMANNPGTLTIRNSTISGNSAPGTGGAGGGIYFSFNGSLLVENSTISGNTTGGEGGGIYFYGTVGAGGLTVRNSTISGNSGTNGGGICLNTVTGTLLVQNSTITANTASGNGGGISQSTGTGATITVTSSIVSGNTNTAAPDLRSAGTVNANFSAVGSATGFTPSASSGNNLAAGASLNLQPLANNGGPTLTHALGTGSLAINAGSNPANLTTDQRGPGFVRVNGAAADIGALESQPVSLSPRVASTAINGGAAQRSMVTTLSVTFSTTVTFASTPGAAFTLTRVGGGAVSFTATAGTVGGVTVVTLNAFTGAEANAGSLNDGRYTLTALASQITAGGAQLDGNGDGTGGDNFTLGPAALFRLYGDFTGDARVDNADFFQFRTTFGLSSSNPAFLAGFDYNGDGVVDNADFFQFRTRFGTSI